VVEMPPAVAVMAEVAVTKRQLVVVVVVEMQLVVAVRQLAVAEM
jgi:hypothetical protein